MGKLFRSLILAMLLLALALPVRAAPSSDINVRDYVTVADCSADVTPQFQAAVNAFRTASANRTAGDLIVPAGCYQLNNTVYFTPADGQPVLTGNVRGDGPSVTTIQGRCGVRTFVIRNMQGGQFGGMHLSGRCGPGNLNRNTNANHTGLLIGSLTNAMGTNRMQFHNLTCEHYSRCYVVGDYETGGSAAELNFTVVGASQVQVGFHVVSYNSLDLHFDSTNVGEADQAYFVQNAYGVHWTNGAGANNYRVFYLASSGEFTVRGWREELDRNSANFAYLGGPASDTHFTVIGSTVVDQVSPKRASFNTIDQITPASSVTLIGNTLIGKVKAKKITALNNTFTGTGDPIARFPGQWLVLLNNCVGDLNNGTCTLDIPPEITGL